MIMRVARVSRQNVGSVTQPGRYMFKFGWVTITAEDLAIWAHYPEATFALYEAPGPERLNDDYRLGSVQLTVAQPETEAIEPAATTAHFQQAGTLGKSSPRTSTVDNPRQPSSTPEELSSPAGNAEPFPTDSDL